MLNANHSHRLMVVIPSLRGGGAERVAVDLAKRWVFDGHEVILVTQSDPSSDVYRVDERVRRVSLNTFGKTGVVGHLTQVRRLRQEFRRYRPDLVASFMTSASVFALLASVGLSHKVIVTEHAYPPFQQLSAHWQRLRRWCYPRADQVVTLTQASADWLQQAIPSLSITVIPNAVQWPIQNHEPSVTLEKGKGRHWALAVGRLHPVKGFDLLIDAFARVAAQRPSWDLLILGEGQERDALAQQIARLGLQQRVFLLGHVGNMHWWYNAADLYLLSSRSEGLSNSLQEAMSCGLPCIAYDCDVGPRELIRRGIDGVLVEPAESVPALAQAMAHLMADENLRQRYGSRAVDIRDRYSMRQISGRWQALFDRLLEKEQLA